jgi:type IV secretory pathway VirB10-like protein
MSVDKTPEEVAAAKILRLRADPPPVARLSRKTLLIGGGLLSATLAGALFWSLAEHHKASPQVQREPGPAAPPEGVTGQPRDYRRLAAPRLGPPLPGDLGRPIVAAGGRDGDRPSVLTTRPSSPKASDHPSVSPAESPGLFFALVGERKVEPASPAPSAVGAPIDARTTSPERLVDPVSRHILLAGTVIPGALVTGLRSDAPGLAVGQVTRDVFDGLGQGIRLIPAGARLIGAYDTDIAAGAARLRIKWTRLILPTGRSIMLDDLPAADPQGFAGLRDSVDRHGGAVLGAAALSTVLALGAEAGNTSGDDAVVEALRRGGARAVSDVGQQAVSKALALSPVLTVRPGAPLTVLLSRDLVLEPYDDKVMP